MCDKVSISEIGEAVTALFSEYSYLQSEAILLENAMKEVHEGYLRRMSILSEKQKNVLDRMIAIEDGIHKLRKG